MPKSKKGSHVYGWLQLPRAGKPIKCRSGKNCAKEGLIMPGERYVSIARWRMPYKRVDRSGDAEVRSYDEAPTVVAVKAKVYPTRLHFDCLVGYLQFMADRQEEWVKAHPSEGRPVGVGAVAVLSPEERKYRRALVRRRAYLQEQLLKEKGQVMALALCRLLLDNRRAIDGTGAPLQESLSRRPDTESRALQVLYESHACRTGPAFHELSEDLSCIHCGKVYKN